MNDNATAPQAARALVVAERRGVLQARLGLGRTVALHHRSPTLYQTRERIRRLCVSEAATRRHARRCWSS
jgi:hypothetical protein